jgi:radical SAM protein with 4Fe4S-binding SPASM domain
MNIVHSFMMPFKNAVRQTPWFRSIITRIMTARDFPAVVGIDSAGGCNLDCTFCGTKHIRQNSPGLMDFELYSRIINELSQHKKLWMLILHNFGEPLLNPRLADMVVLAKKKNVSRVVQFSTNATLLTQKRSNELINAKLDGIVISVDALTREEYTALKGCDLFDEVISNTKGLMKEKQSCGSSVPFVSAKMVKRQGFEHTFKPFLSFWKKIVDEAALTSYSNWGGSVSENGLQPDFSKRYACHFLWYYPAIAHDGKVFCCCATADDEAIIGDIRTQSLYDIWHGEKLAAIRQAHLKKRFSKIRPCAKCTYWAESNVNLDVWLQHRGRSL